MDAGLDAFEAFLQQLKVKKKDQQEKWRFCTYGKGIIGTTRKMESHNA